MRVGGMPDYMGITGQNLMLSVILLIAYFIFPRTYSTESLSVTRKKCRACQPLGVARFCLYA